MIIPPKNIIRAFRRTCFDNADANTDFNGKPVGDRIIDCWEVLHEEFFDKFEHINEYVNSEQYKTTTPRLVDKTIWCYCFDRVDLDTVINGKTVAQRLDECWQALRDIIREDIEAFKYFIVHKY